MLGLWPGLASAASLPSPTEAPILVISGEIGVSSVGGTAQFDRPMLEAMMNTTIGTRTPWFGGVSRFEGVPMSELMGGCGRDR